LSRRRPPLLSTPRLQVRLPAAGDASRIAAYMQRVRLRYEPPLPEVSTRADYWASEWRAILNEYTAGTACRCFIFLSDESRVIGSVTLGRIQRGIRYDCALSYALDVEYEGQGMMHEAAGALLGYAFSELGLHRVEAAYRPGNDRSERLLKRLGFEPVGLVREYAYCDGIWLDAKLCSLINDAWLAPKDA
jgi:[ribosomal protein S5]-alanine N-acetyltransferase